MCEMNCQEANTSPSASIFYTIPHGSSCTGCTRSRRRSRPDGAALTRCWWPASATTPAWSSLVALCREAGVRVRQESREQLTQLAQTPAHQGVVALVRPQEFLSIEDLFAPDPASNAGPPAAGSRRRRRPAKSGRAAARGRRRRSGRRGAHRAPLRPAEPGRRQGQRRRRRAPAHRPRRQPGPRARRAEAPEPLDHRSRRTREHATTTTST